MRISRRWPVTEKQLSSEDALVILQIIHVTLRCSTEGDYSRLINRLRSLIPFRYSGGWVARLNCSGFQSYEVLNVSYPCTWLEQYLLRQYFTVDPVVLKHFRTFAVQYWPDTYRTEKFPVDILRLAEPYGLEKGYSAGIAMPGGAGGSFFAFAGQEVQASRRTEEILGHLVPHLHNALFRVLSKKNGFVRTVLSMREKDILCWIRNGKSTWEISVILGISQRTVTFHISNIMKKLGVATRTQAVADAIALRLIGPD